MQVLYDRNFKPSYDHINIWNIFVIKTEIGRRKQENQMLPDEIEVIINHIEIPPGGIVVAVIV